MSNNKKRERRKRKEKKPSLMLPPGIPIFVDNLIR